MKYLVPCVLFLLTFGAANNLPCQLFDSSRKLLETYCENYNRLQPNNCANENPTLGPFDATQFKFGSCDRTTISETFNYFQLVRALDISYSGYKSLDWLNSKLDRLEKFNGSFNELTVITNFLSNAPEVNEVDLSHNKLWSIDAGTFARLNKVKTIYLSHNVIRSINIESFKRFTDLELIDLSHNRLWDVPDLFNNKQLKLVHIEGNPITTFSCFNIHMMKSASLYLSWTQVTAFYGNMHCHGEEFHVVRDEQNEGVLRDENAQLEIHCNAKSFVKLELFEAGPKSFLNVQDILKHCFGSSITKLDLSGNFVGTLDRTAFQKFSNLRELRLSDTMLAEFDFDVIYIPSRLNSLDISFNSLNRVSNVHLLVTFTGLHDFKATKNQLQNTRKIIQYIKPSIQNLDLSGNLIGDISATTFNRISGLRTLNLSDTNLSILTRNSFDSLSNLRSLDISHNDLARLNLATLSATLNQLEYFYAVDCQIADAAEAFKHLRSSIVELDLSGNSIGALNFSTESLTKLELLNLSNSNLRNIDFGTSEDTNIQSSIKSISLAENELKKIQNFDRTAFPHLKTMEIANNQFKCDDLQEFMEYWNGIEFNNDSFIQMHGKDCRSPDGFLKRAYNAIKFW